jgi:peptidoglycan/LPS O-acetylase OafA/YrhL
MHHTRAVDRRGEKPPSVTGLFVPTVHGLRGWAILAVFVYHVVVAVNYFPHGDVPGAFVDASYFALHTLFFITGLVLFLPVVRQGGFGEFAPFAVRRFGRIAPPYYVCLLVILVTFPLLTTEATSAAARNGVGDYLAHLLFLQREVLQGDAGLGVNGPVWALSIDFAFYLLLPLVAGAYLKRPLLGLAVATGAGVAWRLAVSTADPGLLIQLPLFLGDFAAGMTAAWALLRLSRRDRPIPPRIAAVAAAAALAALVGVTYLGGATVPRHGAVFLGSGLAGAAFPLLLMVLIVSISLAPRALQWPLTNRPAQWFSEVSYSFYLYHGPVVFFGLVTLGLSADGSPRDLLVMTAFALPATLLLAVASYRLVELPARRYARSLSRRLKERRARRPAPRAKRDPVPAQPSLSAMDRFTAGDPLRGLGAIAVLLAHLGLTVATFSGQTGPEAADVLERQFGLGGAVFLAGGPGLVVFLMLSGYLIGRPFIRAYLAREPRPPLGPYAANRALRILPALWFAATLYLVLVRPAGDSLADTSGVYLLFQNYQGGNLAEVMQHVWSVDVEAAFYVVLALVAVAAYALTPRTLGRSGRLALLLGIACAALVLSTAYRLYWAGAGDPVRTLPGAFSFFIPGIVLAALEPSLLPRLWGGVRGPWVARALAAVAVVGLVVWCLESNGNTSPGLALAILATVACSAAIAAPMVLQWSGRSCWRLLDSKPLHWLGERSYSFYLLHMLPMVLVDQWVAEQTAGRWWDMLLLLTAVELLILLPATELSYRFVEKPFLALKRRRRSGSLRPLAQAPAGAASPTEG